MEMLKRRDKIFVCAHRGYMSRYPENSLLAFQKALDMKVDAIEMDLHYSKDKKIIVIHDDNLDRMTNGTGKVADFTYEELKRYRLLNPDGSESEEHIPLFEDYLELTKNEHNLTHIVEVKSQPLADQLFEEVYLMLEAANLVERTLLTTFDYRVTLAAKAKGMAVQSFASDKMKYFDNSISETDYFDQIDVIGLFIQTATKAEIDHYIANDLQFTLVPCDTLADVEHAVEIGVNILASNDLVNSIAYRNAQNKLEGI